MTKRTKKETPDTGTSGFKSLVYAIWAAIAMGIVVLSCIFIYIAKTQLPNTKELENPEYEIATKILDNNNRELGKAFKLNREWLTFDEINPVIIDALVSTEDERYFDHSGVDFKGTVRAIVFMGRDGGASTITQQLAKQFFTKRSSTFVKRVWQKLKEWVIAIEFEKRYTKEEILAMYLNKYDFIYGAIGISSAAKTYFGKNQKDLSVEEAATLIGLLKNPWIYNPKVYPDRALQRRSVVMNQMVKNKKLSKEAYKKGIETPIDLSNFRREDNYNGIASYFRAELVKDVKQILNQDKYSKPDGSKYDLYTDGLVIRTTIDYDMQRHAESAMIEHMSSLQELYFKRWEKLDPWSYKADDNQKKIRQASLLRQIRESDRFLALRDRYIGKISSQIVANIKEAKLNDNDIFRLFNADKDPKSLSNLVSKKDITREQARVYNDILKSKYWPELKKQWNTLQNIKDTVFKKKVTMKVFDYNESREKTVEMSPLDSIKYHNMLLQIGSISVHPKTGHIKTWVGGIDHKHFKFDHVRSNRQVGSTFKPFIYGTAIIERAMSPCEKVLDIQHSIVAGDPIFKLAESWSPSNSDGKFSGVNMTLKEALKQSKNSVSVALMKEIGSVERVRSFAELLGIDKNKIPPYPSICLGTPELSVMDMAGAYTALANDGIYTKPMYIKSIEDSNGKVIYTGVQEKKRAISSGYNYVMVDMLKYAASFMTNKFKFKSEVGGKTGTTNDHKDGWFMGITPDLVVATWVGGDNEWIRFYNIADGQGSVMARPYFSSFLQKLEADPNSVYNPDITFFVPEDQVVELDCTIYDGMAEKDKKAAEILEKERKDRENEMDEEF